MDELRASDADRERVVAMLREQVGAGRLTLDEFSDRAAAAYRARTLGELDELTRDLTAAAPTPAASPSRRAPAPVLVALAVVLAAALLALAGPATAEAMGHVMAQVGRMCG